MLLVGLAQILDELPTSIGTLHLAVAENIDRWQQLIVEKVEAMRRVIATPVVAIGKMKQIDIPLFR